ncbi:MAG: hypothetical protein G3M78_13285 [Candidatus Nitrohelix vancouverensis]|uniref:Uncharacterized protein n=1 Tax=Candidatus Nitrohelix vancouverensis TaxID=2705534 RepID=A0A7T0C4E7_9BACT|nr:MAG: hypothetical protein G3M78_13285 [Candidatus Nitrohelix vancouverensis]
MKLIPVILFSVILSLLPTQPAFSFTQFTSKPVPSPMGHEWLTRLGAEKILDLKKLNTLMSRVQKLSDIPLDKGEVKRIYSEKVEDGRFESTYMAVYSAIIGQRFVDFGGTRVGATANDRQCFDAVAQEPVSAYMDHFMRSPHDKNAIGGVQAIQRARNKFVKVFVEAAMAEPKSMVVKDGGIIPGLVTVESNYFLFGRAVHLFQDSFSLDHVVRLPEDDFMKVRNLKGYGCTAGVEEHNHKIIQNVILNASAGDVVWNERNPLETYYAARYSITWIGYGEEYMKPNAVVAANATAELWGAFIRTMGQNRSNRESFARKEAQALADKWLNYDESEMLAWYDDEANRDDTYLLADDNSPASRGKGRKVEDCTSSNGETGLAGKIKHEETIATNRLICLASIEAVPGYDDLYDPYLLIPFNWQWKKEASRSFLPPLDRLPTPSANSAIADHVTIWDMDGKAIQSNRNDWLIMGNTPMEFTVVDAGNGAVYLRSNSDATEFLSYRAATGAVGLYPSANSAELKLIRHGDYWEIINTKLNHHMYRYRKSIYLHADGDEAFEAGNPDARWIIKGMPN